VTLALQFWMMLNLHCRAMTTQIAQQIDSIKDLEERLASLDAEFVKVSSLFTMTKEDLDERTKQLEETEMLLRQTESALRKTRKDRDEQKHLLGKHIETEVQLLSEAKQVGDLSTFCIAVTHSDVIQCFLMFCARQLIAIIQYFCSLHPVVEHS
jgi:hypothetical protein